MIPFPEHRGYAQIATATGYFDLFDPRPEDVNLHDIAVALSWILRFTGHGDASISVARHSVTCYREACRRGLPLDVRRLALISEASVVFPRHARWRGFPEPRADMANVTCDPAQDCAAFLAAASAVGLV